MSARAETVAVLVAIPCEVFAAMVAASPDLAVQLYRDACVRHLLANHTAQTMALCDIRTRLLRFLLDYGFRRGRRRKGSLVIEPAIGVVALAAALGVNRRTIARTLAPLKSQGYVAYEGKSLVLRRLNELERDLSPLLLGLSSRLGEVPLGVVSRWTESLAGDDEEA